MNIFKKCLVGGDIHGQFDLLNSDLENQPVDFGLFTGDNHIMKTNDTDMIPPSHIDNSGVGDFPDYYNGSKILCKPVYSVPGNHENYDLVEEIYKSQGNGTISNIHNFALLKEGLRYLYPDRIITIASLGGSYSPKSFDMSMLMGKRRRHFTSKNINDVINFRRKYGIDIFVCHDIIGTFKDREIKMSLDMITLIKILSPRFMFVGHYHIYRNFQMYSTQVIFMPLLKQGYGIINFNTNEFEFKERI